MGLEDLKKSFDGAITAAANAASDATSIAKKSIQSIDISDAKKVQEKAAAALQSAKNTASDFAENAGAAVSDLVARTTSDENERINGIALQDDRISKIGATRILYYLMAADGDVKPEELEKFDLIGNALLQNYAQIRDSLLQQCEDATSKINENDSRTDAINDLVDKEIETAESSDDDLMDPSLLVWNMLVTAMSDQDYAESRKSKLPAMPPHLSGLGETGSPNSKTAHSRFPISSARLAGSRHPAGRTRKLPLSWPKSRSVKKSYSKAFATSSLSKEDTMPLPVFFIGAAVATGGAGVVKSVKAGIDARTATKMNEDANALVESTTARLNAHRESCGTALSNLGEEKVFVLENSMKTFLDTFTKLKNVDFKETEGLSELSKMRIDRERVRRAQVHGEFRGIAYRRRSCRNSRRRTRCLRSVRRSTGSRLCINRHRHRIVERSSGNQRHARVFRRRIDCCGRPGNGWRHSRSRRPGCRPRSTRPRSRCRAHS